ncbi:MAG: fibronectin type III domain-containing protein [Calditrichaeota bacterium]|nr:MAG: fibronectin type III domain-containing protein [Calditrichota bacterium]
MKKLLLFIALLAWQCNPVSNDNGKPPEPPRMVQKTAAADTTLEEPGTDAVARAENAIQIMWYREPASAGITRYKIYRSDEPDGKANYRFIGQQEVNNREDTVFVDLDGLTEFTPYYYFITAVNENNQESLPSDTVWYSLLPKANPTYPKGLVTVPDSLGFTFNIPANALPNGYIFRVERLIGANFKELVYLYVENPLKGNFGETQFTYVMNKQELLVFQDDVEYRWRIDLLAGDQLHNGSESDWATFSIDWGN